MIEDLIQVMQNKTICEVLMGDGDNIKGFITYVDINKFHIVRLDAIIAQNAEISQEINEYGEVEMQVPVHDVIFSKCSRLTELVVGIDFDISHIIEPEMLKTLIYARDNIIYKEPEVKQKKKRIKKVIG